VRGRALDLARDSISSKRIKFDELLHNILGVRFFIPAITALEASRGDDDDSIFPAVAYFIVYSHSDLCNGDTLLNAIQNEDRQANVVPINLRRCDRLLFNVVKDHSNDYVNAMVAASNRSGIQRQLINLGVILILFSSSFFKSIELRYCCLKNVLFAFLQGYIYARPQIQK
jgi:uncharacterized protein (UPF0128 family)